MPLSSRGQTVLLRVASLEVYEVAVFFALIGQGGHGRRAVALDLGVEVAFIDVGNPDIRQIP